VVPVLIINLERDVARRDALTARLDALNVPYRLHKAIAGKDLSPEEIARHSPKRELAFGRGLMPNEIAAGLSHVAAVREGLSLGTEFFCVLEDDTVPAPRFFAECLDEAVLKDLPAFDALRLFAHFDRWEKPSKTIATLAGSVVVRMLRPGWGCAGQIYTRAGGQKIVSSMRFISAPIDFAIYHDCHVMGLKVLEMRPPLITHAPVPSSVGNREIPEPPVWRPVRNMRRLRRKVRAAQSFLKAWGLREFLSFFPTWR
jgi:GR25 family glycosyltransferase involved in LPS biosynthesis